MKTKNISDFLKQRKYLHLKIILIISLFGYTHNLSAQSGWQLQTPPRLDEFYSVYFINNNTGWIVATNGTFLKTTNAGVNWELMPDLPNWNMTSVQFLNELTGWTVGSTATLMKTNNGGINWFNTSCTECTIADDFFDLQFLNENTGYAMGDRNIFKSTDTGLNWVKLHGNNLRVFKGYFINKETGWTAGRYGISKTTNGGSNWIYFSVFSNYLTDVYFKDENIGWCISSNGSIYKSTNGGTNWSFLYQDSTKIMNSVYFTGYDTGWVIGKSGCVIKTTNGGINWFQQIVPNVNFYDIFMLSSIDGWIVGYNTILYTNDGGGSVGIKKIQETIPEKFNLYQNYPNPFNPITKIRFDLHKSTYTKLTIYDILGKEIVKLIDEKLSAGSYEVEWFASIFDGIAYLSGVYFYRLVTESYSYTRKMLLIK